MTRARTGGRQSDTWSWPVRVDEIAARYPDCLGVSDDTGVQLSWSELAYRSKVVAKALRRRGMEGRPASVYPEQPGAGMPAPTPIVVMLPHTADALATILGILRQGFPLLPLSITHGDERQLLARYREAMRLFAPAAIVSDSQLAQHLLQHRPGTPVLSPRELLVDAAPDETYEDVVTTLDNALAFIFTSGSGGESKCVAATNRMAWAEVQWYPSLFRRLGVCIDPRTDRWRNDHEMGWWGAAYFGELDVAFAMATCIVMMKPTDSDVAGRGVTMMGALPSQLQTLWPGARGRPETLRVLFCWAERCDVGLGQAWKESGVKVADLLIATEFWLSLASCNLELGRDGDGRPVHAMRAVGEAQVLALDDSMQPVSPSLSTHATGLLGVGGPQVTPGYVEMGAEGVAMVGQGPLSRDTFMEVAGEWVAVPKDIVKLAPDQSFLSVGRAGGMVKVTGGVLMSTHVAELELQQRSIAAACITDPLHVEGGSAVVAEMNLVDEWSLRDGLQQTSFLRMPTMFVKKMPRNESTGKVQKALVQAMLQKESDAERDFNENDRKARHVHLEWFIHLAVFAVAPCLLQLVASCQIWQALAQRSPQLLISALAVGVAEALLRWCLIAWTYAAWANAAQIGWTSLAGVPVVLSLAAGSLASGDLSMAYIGPLVAPGLLLVLVGDGVREKAAVGGRESTRFVVRWWAMLRKKTGHLAFIMAMALIPRSMGPPGVSACLTLGHLCIIALQRRLPPPPLEAGTGGFGLQRAAATAASFGESALYMLCFPIAFALAVPTLIIQQYGRFAWRRLRCPSQGLPPKQRGWTYWSNRTPQWSHLLYGTYGDGSLWFDVHGNKKYDAPAEHRCEEIKAETLAGVRAQHFAKQVGLDFHGVDSLKIARLSVMMNRHLRYKAGQEPLEFAELREACLDEQKFVRLIESRMDAMDTQLHMQCGSAAAPDQDATSPNQFALWLQGGATVHRVAAASQTSWNCLVDSLMEWTGSEPIDITIMRQALRDVMQAQPLMRTRIPPDDDADMMLGGGHGFSGITAATWCLVWSIWSSQESWSWPASKLLQRALAGAIWNCWPRTLVLGQDVLHQADVKALDLDSDGTGSVADKVNRHICNHWHRWYNRACAVNACVVTVKEPQATRQFFYSAITHRYSDGGSVAIFLQALNECYEQRRRGDPTPPPPPPSTIVAESQRRFWRFLQGLRSPAGIVDTFFPELRDQTVWYAAGMAVGATFTKAVCDVVRMVGTRAACSEEVAWLACIACALGRLLPDEKLIKMLVMHNGRLGDGGDTIACVCNHVVITVPCANARSNTPLADVVSRVKFAIANGKFTRPGPCEWSHARINLASMVGEQGPFRQVFRSPGRRKSPSPSWSPFMLQFRMENEGEVWSLKDYKLRHPTWSPQDFLASVIAIALEIAEGCFLNPLGW